MGGLSIHEEEVLLGIDQLIMCEDGEREWPVGGCGGLEGCARMGRGSGRLEGVAGWREWQVGGV